MNKGNIHEIIERGLHDSLSSSLDKRVVVVQPMNLVVYRKSVWMAVHVAM